MLKLYTASGLPTPLSLSLYARSKANLMAYAARFDGAVFG